MANYTIPTSLAGTVTLAPGQTQPGIPLARNNEGATEPTIVVVDGAGNPTDFDVTGTVTAPDTGTDATTVAINVGASVPGTPTLSLYGLAVQGGAVDSGIAINVVTPTPETDIFQPFVQSSLPKPVPFSG